jgi:hypothetical protein
MRSFSRLSCTLLTTACLFACSDSNNSTIDLTPPEPPVSTFSQATVKVPSAARPAYTPGTPGVVVDNEKLLRQFGSADVDFNQAIYTRYFLSDQDGAQPDAIVVLIPGFEGGAATFYLLAENLLRRAAADANLVVEVWAVDRRSNHLEDRVGLDLAEDLNDSLVGLDFLFGDALGLELSPALADGPDRRSFSTTATRTRRSWRNGPRWCIHRISTR